MSGEMTALGKCQACKATEKALLIRVLATGFEAWMPRQAVEWGEHVEMGQVFEAFVATGLWERKQPVLPEVQVLPYRAPAEPGLTARRRRRPRSMKGRRK